METIGGIFLQIRAKHGLSQKAIAAELGISVSYVSHLESGKFLSISDELLQKFSARFGLHSDELNFACDRMPQWMWDAIMSDPMLFRDLCRMDRKKLEAFVIA